MTRRATLVLSLLVLSLFALGAGSCAAARSAEPASGGVGSAGVLLAIGGGLDDDNAPVYGRFRDLASRGGPARIVIATAASGDEDDAERGKRESIGTWCPGAKIDAIRRGTPTAETVALIDSATAMFFTGGDQKRITDRYRPGDAATPEWEAMKRLLARGGVIAGTSAGDAMMGDVMFFTGRSAEALGIRPPRARREGDADAEARAESREESPLGPQIGPGMRLFSFAMTDSHFFERDRVGRLGAALEQSGVRFGIGVGEDACVEIDLATGVVTGTSVAESLLVDAGALRRDGLARRGLRAAVIRQGARFDLRARLAAGPAAPPARPSTAPVEVAVAEPGQNRQLASWRLFRAAEDAASAPRRLALSGWRIVAWPDGRGESVFDLEPHP
jgi:cyanophycinase